MPCTQTVPVGCGGCSLQTVRFLAETLSATQCRTAEESLRSSCSELETRVESALRPHDGTPLHSGCRVALPDLDENLSDSKTGTCGDDVVPGPLAKTAP